MELFQRYQQQRKQQQQQRHHHHYHHHHHHRRHFPSSTASSSRSPPCPPPPTHELCCFDVSTLPVSRSCAYHMHPSINVIYSRNDGTRWRCAHRFSSCCHVNLGVSCRVCSGFSCIVFARLPMEVSVFAHVLLNMSDEQAVRVHRGSALRQSEHPKLPSLCSVV